MNLSKSVRETVLAVAKRLAAQAMRHANSIPGNASESYREDAALEILKERVAYEVEARDHLIPVVGQYLDLPVVDAMQREAEDVILRAFLRREAAAAQLARLQVAQS